FAHDVAEVEIGVSDCFHVLAANITQVALFASSHMGHGKGAAFGSQPSSPCVCPSRKRERGETLSLACASDADQPPCSCLTSLRPPRKPFAGRQMRIQHRNSPRRTAMTGKRLSLLAILAAVALVPLTAYPSRGDDKDTKFNLIYVP